MADREFSAFSLALNPFRVLDRQIDRMFDDGFGAGAAGAVSRSAGTLPSDSAIPVAPSSLFMRVVGITTRKS